MIIPKPAERHVTDGHFVFPETLTVWLSYQPDPGYAHFVADELTQALRVASGSFVTIRTAEPGQTPPTGAVILTDEGHDPDLGKEGYQLRIAPGHIKLIAGANPGLFYAGQSLLQVLNHHRAACETDTRDGLPCTTIIDKPRFGWRGFMLDSVRHFQPIELVYKIIDQLAALKLNRFHWHLTDDQGWRVEMLGYPKLTSVGAWRPNGGGGRYGGFYTRAQVQGLVEYAKARNITVIPEFDMPGHSMAALAAYPEFGCRDDDYEVQVTFGIDYAAFCAGNESTFQFLESILGEFAELFPAPYIHLGGDERKPGLWDNCEKCCAARDSRGLPDEGALQKWFMDRVSSHVHDSLCRRTIVWGDNIDAGSTEGQIVQGWLPGQAVAGARQGHDVINSIHESVYLNYTNIPEEITEEMPTWMRVLPIEDVYDFDPIPEDLEPELHHKVLGSESHLWTEFVRDEATLVRHLVPRLYAFSEAIWTDPAARDFEGFKQRLTTQQIILEQSSRLG